MTSVHIRQVVGEELTRWLPVIAELRITVFREWPYCYAGDAEYERQYLAAYAQSPRSVAILAFAGDRVVGASTALPLSDESDAFHRPFSAPAPLAASVFYLGESVLLPAYRGQGIGHRFFTAREAHARQMGGFTWTGFAAVDRASDDPRRPAGHRGHNAFWTGRGYRRRPELTMHLAWTEIGATAPTAKPLTFWLRPLEP